MALDYKLIGSDLDGTFLNSKSEGSPENHAALKQLQNLGVHFVPISGRSFGEMPAEIQNSPYIRYYIGSDGGSIYDKQTGQSKILSMPQEASHYVLDTLKAYSVSVMLHADNRSYVDQSCHKEEYYRAHNYNDTWVNFIFSTNNPVENFQEFAYRQEYVELYCVFFKNYEDLLECKETLQKHPQLHVTQSHKYNLDIGWTGAGKGNALMLLADSLGIKRAATIAVGDSSNDITMIQKAGLGLAMANAVPELKAAADEVICHCNAHSTQYILEHYILK